MTFTSSLHRAPVLPRRAFVLWPFEWIWGLLSAFWMSEDARVELDSRLQIRRHKALLESATCYAQYKYAAETLDALEGKLAWRKDPVSPDYDYNLIADRLAQLRKLRQDGDVVALSFLLRTTLTRNLGDMNCTKLYGHARMGTKILIHEYIDEVVKQLDLFADETSDYHTVADKLAFFKNIQCSFGTTALLLSGGATFGMIHCGVLKALYQANALPRVISGSSAGSIVAAILCTQTEDNFEAAMDPSLTNKNFYEDPSEVGNIFAKIRRLVQHGCIFDVSSFILAAKANLGGDITFQEAYNKSRRVLNIAVSSSTQYEMPRLLNYLTAPNVVIWSAVAASCALPMMYRSAPLMFKTAKGDLESWNPSGHRWIDGSVEGDLPMARISELFDVNHFIVCQVNPHIMPFLNKTLSENCLLRTANNLAYLIKTEALHRLNQLAEIGLNWQILHRLKSILVQKYSGDITIVPTISFWGYRKLITNPDVELTEQLTFIGERATWPKVPLIENHVKIEMCIDRAIMRLKTEQIRISARARAAAAAAAGALGGSEGMLLNTASANANSTAAPPPPANANSTIKKEVNQVTAVNQEPSNGTKKTEVKDGVKEGSKNGVKGGVKDAAKDGVKDAAKDGVKDAVKDAAKGGVKDAVKDGVKDQTKDGAKFQAQDVAEKRRSKDEGGYVAKVANDLMRQGGDLVDGKADQKYATEAV
ncbi:hypothetical protein HDU78_005170 [Chytriomyces hyalinus]|nr:hypothetical protein HDU78_005170 [Chytriomyces hyalinus]